MFRLITGTPGSSKTSHTIARYLNEKSRPIYYRGIRLTEEGKQKLGWHELDDEQAKSWHEHVPDGAIVILDEAQQLFPVRAPAKRVPPGLQALETHRHHGWDVEFITQEPTLLDSHARKICNEQFHYSRPFGSPFAIQYHCGSGYVSPSNRAELARCTTSRKKLPKETWGLFNPLKFTPINSNRPKSCLSWSPPSSLVAIASGPSSMASIRNMAPPIAQPYQLNTFPQAQPQCRTAPWPTCRQWNGGKRLRRM